MTSKIGAGLVLFSLLMAFSLGVAFAEKEKTVSTENMTLKNNTTMNESINVTLNQTMNKTLTNETMMNKTLINETMNKTMNKTITES